MVPVCIGMMRSASRVTWQIVRYLTPDESRPVDYTIPEWIGKPELDEIWPLRTHEYVSGQPAIYTYRHPVEAFLSLQSKFKLDIGANNVRPDYDLKHAWMGAMRRTGEGWYLFNRLKEDASNGRDVLFLRYEDFYDNPSARITAIADFMGVELSDERLNEILYDTSVKANFQRGYAMSHHHSEKSFSGCSGADWGMQRDHVSPKTMGKPGAWLNSQPEFLKDVIAGSQPALQALKEMCEDLGYEL